MENKIVNTKLVHCPCKVKLRLLPNSRSFLANQKARNAIVEAENLLKADISWTRSMVGVCASFEMFVADLKVLLWFQFSTKTISQLK